MNFTSQIRPYFGHNYQKLKQQKATDVIIKSIT